MATMNISIPDTLRDWVQSRVETGGYAGASDYLRELIRKDQEAVGERAQQFAALNAALERSFADIEAGRVHDADQVFENLRARYTAMIPNDGK
jgi:antitoxin ParD1/3/4